jgi:hypothetical protein
MGYGNKIADFNLEPAIRQESTKGYQSHIKQNAEQKVSPQMTGRFGWKRGLHKSRLKVLAYPSNQNHRPPGRTISSTSVLCGQLLQPSARHIPVMSLLRSLIHLRRRFYKYASPTDFAAFARQKNSNANRPKRPTQNDFGTAFVPTGQPEISPERARPRAQQRCQSSRPRNIQGASPSVPCCGRDGHAPPSIS